MQSYFVSACQGSAYGNGAKARFGCCQIFGNLLINWKDSVRTVSDYKRTLHLDKALAVTEWKKDGITFKEEVLSSVPQKAIIIRLSATKSKSLNFKVILDRKENAKFFSNGNTITMTWQLLGSDGDLGIRFAGYAKEIAINGSKLISKEQMKLEIFEYIEIWYNRKRRHSALNYKNIEEFNNQINYKM
ncbi:hypothetical protein FNW12_15440 [Flavobacterium gawalongense]|uniref:Glycosyl hydrolase family 95 N-terminal domain-containing protein n=1 Tax=Flavobacterium gawalongense TaxID=2594432 RepID=A0A553BP32_9FLAO|nr:hypothetical protein FNW12_15440 [Flavobacterium gawalongense]TRX03889.1 hypothetical protein FNW33_02150 [Flavobacterium gawalongense]TRX10000.1 hypothetical protein FNW11_08820 [Flavobacterium gawalongense]